MRGANRSYQTGEEPARERQASQQMFISPVKQTIGRYLGGISYRLLRTPV